MDKQTLINRTKNFAHSCVRLSMKFPSNKLGNHIQGQLIRSSTSVAANYRAVCLAQSGKSFIAKLSIVIKEVDESNFWFDFADNENLIDNKEDIIKLLKESSKLTAILVSTRKTMQLKLNNK